MGLERATQEQPGALPQLVLSGLPHAGRLTVLLRFERTLSLRLASLLTADSLSCITPGCARLAGARIAHPRLGAFATRVAGRL